MDMNIFAFREKRYHLAKWAHSVLILVLNSNDRTMAWNCSSIQKYDLWVKEEEDGKGKQELSNNLFNICLMNKSFQTADRISTIEATRTPVRSMLNHTFCFPIFDRSPNHRCVRVSNSMLRIYGVPMVIWTLHWQENCFVIFMLSELKFFSRKCCRVF